MKLTIGDRVVRVIEPSPYNAERGAPTKGSTGVVVKDDYKTHDLGVRWDDWEVSSKLPQYTLEYETKGYFINAEQVKKLT